MTDFRRILDDKSVDAISIGLGDRWHALSTIWACQAGKHVYVDKPGTHNLFEGRQMVAAARKYDRMVQHGTQNRSSPNIMEGIQKLREGVIGDLYMARGIDYKMRGNLGKITPTDVPPGLDWDKWLGPKPMRPYSQFWHRRWYWNLELASGCFANQAVHELDVIRWGLGLDTHPTEVTAMGGKFVHEDDRTSPTHVAISYRFGDAKPLVTYEHRSWYTNSEAGFREQYPFVQPDFPVGTMFFGSDGYLIFPDYSSYYTFLGTKREPGPSKPAEIDWRKDRGPWQTESIPHFRNWVAAIRAGEPDTPMLIVNELPTAGRFAGINTLIPELNAHIKRVAERHGCAHLDFHRVVAVPAGSARAGELRAELTWDGLHLNDAGYALLAQQIEPFLPG